MAEIKKEKSQEERLAKLELQVEELKKHGGGMLSSADFLQLVIKKDCDRAKKDFWSRRFDSDNQQFIIDPFDPRKLTPFSYDLSVGEQVYSCSRMIVKETKALENETYWMAPRETIVVKTKEFVALPPRYAATVWPRFKMPVESIFQSMVKIDPTWYGELGVAITNLSAGKYPIKRGDTFATLVIYELKTITEMYLYRKENMPEFKEIPLGYDSRLNIDKIREKIKDSKLEKICEIEDNKIRLKIRPNEECFRKLLDIDEAEEWMQAVLKSIGSLAREMDGLGLTTLDMVRPTPVKAEKLTKKDVQDTECTAMDLENAAIDHGIPFNLLPAIPELIMQNIEREIAPRIRAEVEASLFPKTVTLTLTVLGFLSFVIAVVAFVMEKYRPGSPSFISIEWPITVTIVSIMLAIILLVSLTLLLARKSPDSRAISRLNTKMEKIEKSMKTKDV